MTSGHGQPSPSSVFADRLCCTQAADLASTRRTIIAILTILRSRNEFDLLCQHITLLAKKHGQLRQAVQAMVEEAMKYLDGYDGDTLLKLIEVLREVTEGKVGWF
jgi:26S proteasome regulatory subunit N5